MILEPTFNSDTEQLWNMAFCPLAKDKKLSQEEKRNELARIEGFISTAHSSFDSTQLPELLYLRRRVSKLNESRFCPLIQEISTIILQLKKKASDDDLLLADFAGISLSSEIHPKYKRIEKEPLKSPLKNLLLKLKQCKSGSADVLEVLQAEIPKPEDIINMMPCYRRFDVNLGCPVTKALRCHGIDVHKLRRASSIKPNLPQSTYWPFVTRLLIEAYRFFCPNHIIQHQIIQQIPDAKKRYEWVTPKIKLILQEKFNSGKLDPIRTVLQDKEGQKREFYFPLHYLAILIHDGELLTKFYQAGLDPQAIDERGYRAIHIAAMCRSLELIQLLAKLGADIYAKTEQGATIFDFLAALEFAKPKNQPKLQPVRQMRKNQATDAATQVFQPRQHNAHTPETLFVVWDEKPKNGVFSEIDDVPEISIQDQKDDVSSVTKNIPKISREVKEKVYAEFLAIQNGKAFSSPFSIRRIMVLSQITHPLDGKLEAYANRPIARGEFIIELTGYVQSLTELQPIGRGLIVSHDTYGPHKWPIIDRPEPPNCLVLEVFHHGMPRALLYAIHDIDAGSPFNLPNDAYYDPDHVPKQTELDKLAEEFYQLKQIYESG